jgi:hypothetical protein
MTKFKVHYLRNERHFKGTKRGARVVSARSEDEAIARIRHKIAGSYGHWVEGV